MIRCHNGWRVRNKWCMCYNWCCNMMCNRRSMMGHTAFLDNGIETVNFVSGVCDFTDGTIWFGQWITAVNNTVGQCFFLVLVVTSVWIADAIAKAVNYQWENSIVFLIILFTKKISYSSSLKIGAKNWKKKKQRNLELTDDLPIVWIWIDGLMNDVFGNNWSMGNNRGGMHNRSSMN